mmetsp:Transcript_8491/g.9877  ORF Transcript_8491/g.9877 Transcript_8491/m.9877 type:complete len:108 (+) Transcript_8491:1361-1684(+)
MPVLSQEEKAQMRNSDGVLMPLLVDKEMMQALHGSDPASAPPTEKKMAFLVHLEVNKMMATVYTTNEFAEEQADAEQEMGNQESDSGHSDEMSDGGNEFAAPPTTQT